jgi:hypothetical protein
MGMAGTGNHFLHSGVFGAGIFQVVINSPDGIKAFTELSAGAGRIVAYRHPRCTIHKRYTR